MGALATFTITNDGQFLIVTSTTGNVESFNLDSIKDITCLSLSPSPGTYPYADMNRVTVEVNGREADLTFDLAAVTNQAGWTLNQAGCTQAQTDIRGWLVVAGGVGAGATEATLISVLNAIVASDQDIELLLVRDEAVGNGNPVLKQVTNYETGVPVVTYENVDGTTYVPAPNPVPVYVYLDPSAVLSLVLASIQAQGLVPQATEATLLLLEAKLNSLGQKASADSAPVVLSTEQEAILVTIDSVLDAIKLDTANISTDPATQTTLELVRLLLVGIDADTNAIKTSTDNTATTLANATATDGTVTNNIGFLALGSDGVNDQTILTDATGAIQLPVVTRTAAALRVGAGVTDKVGAGSRSASFMNIGDVDSTVAGAILAPGESITFDAGGQRDLFGDINYVTGLATGGLLITTVV